MTVVVALARPRKRPPSGVYPAGGGDPSARDPLLRIPGLRDERCDCFVGASLTSRPTYTWRVR